MKPSPMIEIKTSRKLHSSGYRMMEVSFNDEILSSSSDVLHIGFKDWLDGLHLDIDKKGVIRIWSWNYNLVPNKNFQCSDTVVMIGEKINDR